MMPFIMINWNGKAVTFITKWHNRKSKKQYADVWMEYQVEWNQYLPMVPLYSNEYFDIFRSNVKNVLTSPVYGIGRAAIDVTVE